MNQFPLLLENVTVKLGGEAIFANVNLQVHSGDTLVVIGPSGGGKTVLLKTMAGIYAPTIGTVYCEGEDWQNLKSEKKRELARHIGVQFQKSALFDSLTAAENVAFPLREHTSWNETQIQEKVDECLEAVGLSQARSQMPYELSGGMQLRLGIARALALNPAIVFYDDPTAGLDPINTDKMVELIQRLKIKYQSTVIFVTHSISVAYAMAGRIVLVAKQKVLETGTVEQTQNHPDPMVQQFIHGRIEGPLVYNHNSTKGNHG